MNDAGAFSGDVANLMRWITGAGMIAAGLAALVVGATFLRGAAGMQSPAGRWALLVGILLLPLMTMVSGNVAGLYHVKQSCADCHTMDPWIKDMKDPASTTLAAKHYQNRLINEDQCYTCHSGYGLAGNVRSKLDGLSHVTHYYVTGVPKEIHLKRPFQQETCLHCHANGKAYRAVDAHVDPDVEPKILSGEMSCFFCHDPPHPRKAP